MENKKIGEFNGCCGSEDYGKESDLRWGIPLYLTWGSLLCGFYQDGHIRNNPIDHRAEQCLITMTSKFISANDYSCPKDEEFEEKSNKYGCYHVTLSSMVSVSLLNEKELRSVLAQAKIDPETVKMRHWWKSVEKMPPTEIVYLLIHDYVEYYDEEVDELSEEKVDYYSVLEIHGNDNAKAFMNKLKSWVKANGKCRQSYPLFNQRQEDIKQVV